MTTTQRFVLVFIMSFCEITFQIELIQIFPVRGFINSESKS